MKMAKKQLNVPAIENGTVIDHIPHTATFKVLQMLEIKDELVTVGNNMSSKKMGLKGLIKISDKELSKHELDKIALIAPQATVCVIKNYEVTEKFKVDIPDELPKIIRCNNPNCITRHQEVETLFHVVKREPLKIKCHHCETVVDKENIEVK